MQIPFRYHSYSLCMPSSISILWCHPSLCSLVTSVSLRSVPSGLECSQCSSPLKPISAIIFSATSRINKIILNIHLFFNFVIHYYSNIIRRCTLDLYGEYSLILFHHMWIYVYFIFNLYKFNFILFSTNLIIEAKSLSPIFPSFFN